MKLTPEQRAMLHKVDVPTHGVLLEHSPCRDSLRRAGLIAGNTGKLGHGKWWIITHAGRLALMEEIIK